MPNNDTKDKPTEEDKLKENNSPVVNTEYKQPVLWAEVFQKFIADLQGVVSNKDHQN